MFGRATSEPRPVTLAAWLAPATACLLFAALILNPQGAATFSGPQQSGGMAALIMSNQSYAAYLPGSFLATHNRLETFAASGGSQSPTNWMQ